MSGDSMLSPSVKLVDEILSTNDPGDDIGARYRYQWSYAAVICCMLLVEVEDIQEVFCEHHEDILIKHKDGTFSGLQVKTRSADQPVWKANDPAVISSCARYAKLEKSFPGQFRAFHLLTNHPFYSGKNGTSLPYMLQTMHEPSNVTNLPSVTSKFLKRIAKEADCSIEIVYTALSKIIALDDLPKIQDIEMRLMSTITDNWDKAKDCSVPQIRNASRNLAQYCERASTLAHRDTLPGYLSAQNDPVSIELTARISAKRINRSNVMDTLEQVLNGTAELIGPFSEKIPFGVVENSLLKKKLDAGGFSIVSQNSAEDLRSKADYLGIVWTKKYGNERGLQQYEHIRSLVLKNAASSFESTKCTDHQFGIAMLSDLRCRFKESRREGSQLYDCSDEHLEGFAYEMTSECTIQWSNDRPWEAE